MKHTFIHIMTDGAIFKQEWTDCGGCFQPGQQELVRGPIQPTCFGQVADEFDHWVRSQRKTLCKIGGV